jgi:phage tail sheath protein FI
MAATDKTPGVYIKEVSSFPPSIAEVATAIPAFIGYTEKATFKGEDLISKATRISSLLEYEQMFGGANPEKGLKVTLNEKKEGGKRTEIDIGVDISNASKFVMYYSLQTYFANGGGPCWIVSVGGFSDAGLDAPTLKKALDVLEQEDEPTLIVFPEAQGLIDNDHFDLIKLSLEQCAKLQDRFVIADLQHSGDGLTTADEVMAQATAFRNGVGVSNLKYGAVYFPNIKTTFDYIYDDGDVSINHTVTDESGSGDGQYHGKSAKDVEASDGALYAAIQRELKQFPVTLPPSSAVAGIYARVDEQRGVWKAPANVDVRNAPKLTFKVTDTIQEDLNVDSTAGKSINAIRSFTGRGNLVWGARTLDGNSNEWRYVPVRRFFNMVEESTKKATARFVFEPNDRNTWIAVRAMIENFLLLQWRAGALQGAKPEDAFYVRIGLNETMTALDILEGRMIVEIGMAVVRPAEFIILR